jgi:DNA primase
MIPAEVIERVRAETDIVGLIASYIKLKRQGRSFVGLCPFHQEKTPSFNVSPDKQAYYCFGCGQGGNAITFLMNYENLSFPEAVKRLAERLGISEPDADDGDGSATRRPSLPVPANADKSRYQRDRKEDVP